MKAITEKTAGESSICTRLDTIRMSEYERRRAYASLRDGELTASLVLRAVADMRAIAQGIAHAAVGLARRIRVTLAKPVKH